MTDVEINVRGGQPLNLFAPLKQLFIGLNDEERIEKAIYLWMNTFKEEIPPYVRLMDNLRADHKRTPHTKIAGKTNEHGEVLYEWKGEVPKKLYALMNLAFDKDWMRDKKVRTKFLQRFRVCLLTPR